MLEKKVVKRTLIVVKINAVIRVHVLIKVFV